MTIFTVKKPGKNDRSVVVIKLINQHTFTKLRSDFSLYIFPSYKKYVNLHACNKKKVTS